MQGDGHIPIAYFALNHHLEIVPPQPGGYPAPPLPDQLVIAPGRYSHYGNTYHFDREGLWRLLRRGEDQQQRIVFNGSLEALLSSLAWVTISGTGHADLPAQERERACMTSSLSLLCGKTTEFALTVLQRLGFRARAVVGYAVRVMSIFSGNGHTGLEVYSPADGKWVFIDILFKTFVSHAGDKLSFLELVGHLGRGSRLRAHRICPATLVDAATNRFDRELNWDQSFFNDLAISPNTMLEFYRAVFHLPVWHDPTTGYFWALSEKTYGLAPELAPLLLLASPEELVEKCYGIPA